MAAGAMDNEYWSQVEHIWKGFPKFRYELPEIICQFWLMREPLYFLEEVMLMDNKILIPKKLWGEVLESLDMQFGVVLSFPG